MNDSIMVNDCSIKLIKGDLTALDVEAFVFYARSDLALGAGFGNAISMRGGPSIKAELDKIGGAEDGQAVITAAGELKAQFIVHAVGPVFQEENTEEKLSLTIKNALNCAEDKRIRQLAFPPMGAGFYVISPPTCARVMVETFIKHLSSKTGLREIIICAADMREFAPFAIELSKHRQGVSNE